MTDLEKIENRGLAIITWRNGYKVGRHAYAVSIDANGDQPTDEQKNKLDWFCTPDLAASIYIEENPDHFDGMRHA